MRCMPVRRVFPLVMALQLLVGCASTQTMQQRFAAMPPIDDVVSPTNWYRPQARVRGAARSPNPEVMPAAPSTRALLWAKALEGAIRYDSLSIVVQQHGRVVAEWYDAASGPQRRYDGQSMHRGLLALVVGAALADGSLPSLTAPVGDYLTEWRNDPRGRLSIEDLLYGRSHFIDPPFELKVDNAGFAMFIGNDVKSQLLALEQVANAAPGRGAAVEAQLLGLILEKATGKPYARYLSEKIWRPIGAGDAYVRMDRPGGSTRTMCCLQASARDWARVGQLVLDRGQVNGGPLLSAAWIDRLRTPNPLMPNISVYWFVKPTPLAPRAFGSEKMPAVPTPFARPDVFYAGGRGGMRTYVIPSLDAVVVRLGKLRYDFDDGVFLNPFLEALAP